MGVRKVVIDVRGGKANVVRCDRDVAVLIRDYDNGKCEETLSDGETITGFTHWSADAVPIMRFEPDGMLPDAIPINDPWDRSAE